MFVQGVRPPEVEQCVMSGSSAIEWTEATWNPVTGCDRVSPGCAHCYALDLAARLKRMGQTKYQRDGGKASGPGFAVTLHPMTLGLPLRWRTPRVIFVNSMSDLFHEAVPDDYIRSVFEVMRTAEQHVFQVLTKRHERLAELADPTTGRQMFGWESVSKTGGSSNASIISVTSGRRYVSSLQSRCLARWANLISTEFIG